VPRVTQANKGPALQRDLSSPQGEAICTNLDHPVANRSNMMNQPQLLDLEVLRCRCRIDVEAGEGKHPGALPLVNGGFDLRSPEKIRLLRGPCAVVGNSDIVVRATDLVLCAVAAEQMSEARTGTKMRHGTVPLGEVLIASDMTTFAGITALAGLGVAPPRRTTTGTSHCKSLRVGAYETKRYRDARGL
jgi:hypothetical protein